MLELENFICCNKENWKSLLTKEPYNLIINEDDDYMLFKYNQIESDFNQPLVKECRGLILDKHTLKPVALSFEKFWNIQEPLHAEIDWKSSKVQEKVDGSKILVWYDRRNKKWRISTSGTLNAFEANVNGFGDTFGKLFCEALHNINLSLEMFYSHLKDAYCYTFELVSPKSRIVVPYNKTKIYFIGLRCVTDFKELDPNIDSEIINLGIPRPKEYKLDSADACLKATSKMGFDEEGFVVVDKNWNRIKIKSPAYVAAHYIKNNGVTTYSRILEMIELKQDEEFLKIYPEYTERFDKVRNNKEAFFSNLKDSIQDLNTFIKALGSIADRSILANYIMQNYKDTSAFMFKFLDTNLIEFFIETEWSKLSKNKKLKYLGFKEESDSDKFKEE